MNLIKQGKCACLKMTLILMSDAFLGINKIGQLYVDATVDASITMRMHAV